MAGVLARALGQRRTAVAATRLRIRNGTALFQLAGILSGHAPLHQALAAECATNLASAGPWSSKLLTPLGSYLVSNLSSPLPILKKRSRKGKGGEASTGGVRIAGKTRKGPGVSCLNWRRNV